MILNQLVFCALVRIIGTTKTDLTEFSLDVYDSLSTTLTNLAIQPVHVYILLAQFCKRHSNCKRSKISTNSF